MRVQSLFVDAERSIMMNKEIQDHEFIEATSLDGGGEAPDSRRGSKIDSTVQKALRATGAAFTGPTEKRG